MTTQANINDIFQTWFAAVVEFTLRNGSYVAFAEATVDTFKNAHEASMNLPSYDNEHCESFKGALDNLRAAATSLMQPQHASLQKAEEQIDRLMFGKWSMFADPVIITQSLAGDLLDTFVTNTNLERKTALSLYQAIDKATKDRKNLVLG